MSLIESANGHIYRYVLKELTDSNVFVCSLYAHSLSQAKRRALELKKKENSTLILLTETVPEHGRIHELRAVAEKKEGKSWE
jgi:hypothetical protein